MFRKMPFILLAIILLVRLLGHWIPDHYQSMLYGISLSIKSVIVFLLPLVVFGLLFKTSVNLSNKASKTIVSILAFICCSNYLSTLLSYSVGNLAYHFDLSMSFPSEQASLQPLWNLSLPKWIENDLAMFSGLALGLIFGRVQPHLAKAFSVKIEIVIKVILRAILFVIPPFITGFVIKMNHDQIIGHIFSNYSVVFVLIATALLSYILLIYLCANRFHIKDAIHTLKNMLPAAITGFGSMSSAAAMPLTILGAEKNSKNPDFARSIIPMTVNVHLVGDCFAIPIFAFAVMKGFGMAEPSIVTYLVFALFFILAKFSVAAVPGGGILVMLPILEQHLGFNPEMLSLITALYILFDPVITCANILGNGGFALVIENLSKAAIGNDPCHTDQTQEALG